MPFYLDDAQRKTVAGLGASLTWRTEWPTWGLIVAIYAGWFGVATHAGTLGLPLTTVLLVVLGVLYMSLQHELLHGHPTRSRFVNGLIGFAPLGVWFPYAIYRNTHLQHHDDPHLTRPGFDPESFFVAQLEWQRAGKVLRGLLTFRNTFVGRLAVGPAFSIAASLADGLRKIARNDWRDTPVWIAHLAALAALTGWLDNKCGIPPWLFIGVVGYSALSLNAVRSFHEHRAADAPAHRSVINEAALFWRLLFLNNNYHAVHHDLPLIPWFALRGVYRARRAEYQRRNGGFIVEGYSEWLKRFAFTPVACVAHPFADATNLATRHATAPTQTAHPPVALRTDDPPRLAG
jgi:fatty acid desaturase